MEKGELRVLGVVLLALLAVSEGLLAHNTLYTEGEVMQGLYWILVGVNIPILGLMIWCSASQ